MSLVWDLSTINSELNRDDKFLLLALADHANDDGECYPSLSKIQKKCFFSRQGLLNSMDRVIRIGYVSKNKRLRENGSNTSNLYRIHEGLFRFTIEEAKLLEATKKKNTDTKKVAHGVDKGGLPDGLGVVNDVDKGSLSDGLVYEPSFNRYFESSFNLSLARVDFKTFKKNLIQIYPAFQFSLSGKLGYSESHQGFCLKDGYIFDLHINKLLDKDDSFTIWSYLFKKREEVFKVAQSQIQKEAQL